MSARASTALHDLLQGYSKQMRHLRKHHRVSISLINEAFDRPEAKLDFVPSGENTVAILTKPLGPEKHAYHSYGLALTAEVCKSVLTNEGIMSALAFFRNQSMCGNLKHDDDDLVDVLWSALSECADELAVAAEML